MPDERTAQRLLDILAMLEHTLSSARPRAMVQQNDEQMAALQAENASLKNRQSQALQRLKDLMARLPNKHEPAAEEQAA